MAENSILSLMVTQHALLEVLFLAAKDEVKNNPERAKSFLSEFSWEIKKHFFVEEGAIFVFSPEQDPEISETIKRLKYEHILMLDKLGKMQDNLSSASDKDLEDFSELLVHHREEEEKTLYPALDQKLSGRQKELIASHINEIPIKNK